jgi:hypothetical protein
LYARSKITLKWKTKIIFSFECQGKIHGHPRLNEKQSIKEICKQVFFFL